MHKYKASLSFVQDIVNKIIQMKKKSYLVILFKVKVAF